MLYEINIIQKEKIFIFNSNNQFILGKSDSESYIYDVLIFARRDIERAIIPPFITKISPYAFNQCKKLKEIEFSENSELKIIGNFAFSKSSIEYIQIPSHVTKICEGC